MFRAPHHWHWMVPAIICVSLAIVPGCGDEEPAPPDPVEQADAPAPVDLSSLVPKHAEAAADADEPVTFDDVKRDTQRTIGTAGAYTVQQKDQLVTWAESELDNLKVKLDEAKAAAAAKGDEAKAAYEEHKADAEAKLAEARAKTAELKESSSEAWQTLSAGLREAMTDVHQTVQEAAGEFSADEATGAAQEDD